MVAAIETFVVSFDSSGPFFVHYSLAASIMRFLSVLTMSG